MKYTTTYQESSSLVKIGGKGTNLRRIQQQFKVPEWFALSVEAFELFLHENRLNESICKILKTGEPKDQSQKIRLLIEKSPMPKSLGDEISLQLDQLTSGYVSVRSSAADEDGGEFSFAGIHESFLYIKNSESVINHVKKVWASGYHERALIYRQENNLSIHPVPMAVIVQRMINAQSSGVVFTINPTNFNVDELVISSLYGLGEGLVGVGLEADHFVYHKNSKKMTQNIAIKTSQMLLDPQNNQGLTEVEVDKKNQEKASLNVTQINELVEVSCQLEKLSHRPQDIEFCYEGNQLYLLQTRDITTVEEYGPAVGNQQIWDNSNIIESYSGVTSPMTFSFIKEAYSVVPPYETSALLGFCCCFSNIFYFIVVSSF